MKFFVFNLFIVTILVVFFSSNVMGETQTETSPTCGFSVKLKQILHNEGFHRNITYGITFINKDEGDRWFEQDCIIALDQKLPAGVYVNPDELRDLRRMDRLNAIPKNRVNIELPTEQSEPSGVYLVGMVSDSRLVLWLPVHARYHKAVLGGGNAKNEIAAPKMYLRCPDQRMDFCGKAIPPSVTFLCNGSKGKCSWKEIPYTLLTNKLTWEVPVGNMLHYYQVAAWTICALVFGSFYLIKVIHDYQVELNAKKRQ